MQYHIHSKEKYTTYRKFSLIFKIFLLFLSYQKFDMNKFHMHQGFIEPMIQLMHSQKRCFYIFTAIFGQYLTEAEVHLNLSPLEAAGAELG